MGFLDSLKEPIPWNRRVPGVQGKGTCVFDCIRNHYDETRLWSSQGTPKAFAQILPTSDDNYMLSWGVQDPEEQRVPVSPFFLLIEVKFT